MLEEDSHLCAAHEMLSEIMEMACCVDQLDDGNLVSCEVAARHLQFIEHEVKKKADVKRRTDPGMDFFLGRTKRSGGALVSPELTKWVASKAAQESSVLKEQRKAAEEQKLARGGGGK